MGLMKDRAVLWHDYYRSSLGREKGGISVTFWLAGRKIETTANVSDSIQNEGKITDRQKRFVNLYGQAREQIKGEIKLTNWQTTN